MIWRGCVRPFAPPNARSPRAAMSKRTCSDWCPALKVEPNYRWRDKAQLEIAPAGKLRSYYFADGEQKAAQDELWRVGQKARPRGQHSR